MERAPKTKVKGEYRERHRILPGCMGGKYIKGNIAYLTPEEHYVAHQLLVKMHPEVLGLAYAAVVMGAKGGNKLYGWLRRKAAIALAENNPMQPGITNRGSFKKGEAGNAWLESSRKLVSDGKKGANNPNFGKPARNRITRVVIKTCPACGEEFSQPDTAYQRKHCTQKCFCRSQVPVMNAKRLENRD